MAALVWSNSAMRMLLLALLAALLLPSCVLQPVSARKGRRRLRDGGGQSGGGGGGGNSVDPQCTQYVPIGRYNPNPFVRESARCYARNRRCYLKELKCPRQCPKRDNNKYQSKACFIDCSIKCQATCKRKKPGCNGYSAMCYDPRFVGGDGVMFYFHGKAGEDFCLVSDHNVHVNAHFIGLRPEGRPRDFTWVQALGILFDNHHLSVAAKKVSAWDPTLDQLVFSYDKEEFTLPTGVTAMWSSPLDEVRVERISETNAVHVTVDGVMTATVEVVPVTEDEDRVHGYHLPHDDAFAHLNVQFNFLHLSASVDGVLGQTYRPDFKNPVKVGVPMPVMGGETKFRVSSLFATDCPANKFSQPSLIALPNAIISSNMPSTTCTTTPTTGGIVCRR